MISLLFLILIRKAFSKRKFYLVKTVTKGDKGMKESKERVKVNKIQLTFKCSYLAHETPMQSQKSTNHKDQNIQSNMQVPQTVKPAKSRNRVIGGSIASKLAEDYETKIEKGQQTRHTFPWMVRITSARICEDGKKVGYCGGSLISKRLIASAYHCTQHTSSLDKVRNFV